MSVNVIPGDRVAFLGVGNMGLHMAAALVNAGFSVIGWSRSARTFSPEPRFEFSTDIDRAVEGARAIVVCVTDHHAVEEILFANGLADRLAAGCLVIDMGTSGAQAARRHHQMLAERGISYLDAPVSGGAVGAKDATLSIFVGGTDADFARGKAVLHAMGTPHHLGPPGAGQTAKLANQIIVGVTIAAVAEGLAFAETNGIDPRLLLLALDGGFAGSRILQLHGPRMAERDYSAPGAVRLHLKDLDLAAVEVGWQILLHAQQVKTGFERLVKEGGSNRDHSSYAMLYQSGRERT